MKKYSTTLFVVGVVFFLFLTATIVAVLLSDNNLKRYAETTKTQAVIAMDSVATLSAAGDNEREIDKALAESAARLAELEEIFARDKQKLEDNAGSGEWISIAEETHRLLTVSKKIAAKSDGAWTVTTGRLAELWGFGTENARVPAEAELKAALAFVGENYVELQNDNAAGIFQARLTLAGVKLDFGGIGKGLAIDELRKIYQQHGVKSGLISFGTSSIYASTKLSGESYQIGIKDPVDHNEVGLVIDMKQEVLSTSGDYERYFMAGGQRQHHLLDPKTGLPARPNFGSVTVVIADSVENAGLIADALSTAAFVMGRERGEKLIREFVGDARIIWLPE